MITIQTIEKKLREEFQPIQLKIIDDSSKHAHHMHNPHVKSGDSITHVHISMVSEKFTGLTKIQRSRAIYKCLAEELADTLHAVALKLKSPAEAE